MGENLFDARHADAQLRTQLHVAPQVPGPPNGVINGEEEPYTIKCICGFLDDDGHTVLCEQCNTWQHIECYYYPKLDVPEVHQCTDCSPSLRPLSSFEAAQRQKRHRDPPGAAGLSATDDRRIKRQNTKTHKKVRTKENNNVPGLQNGWAPQEYSIGDIRNGSPRDQPPPAKRPKTSHRTSTSVSLQTLPRSFGHRDLNGSHDTIPVRPRVPLSDCPPDYLSPNFIRLHREDDDFTIAQTNTYLNIGVANLLAKWLDDVDAFAEATQGRTQNQVLQFAPRPIEDLETSVQQHTREDKTVTFHGQHPIWKYLTADRDIGAGNMIGEIKGTIGRLEDYKADPSNEWERLRHPDHFVFFHPALPIFIDCRREGTLLRYARRSCRPNMIMETIITGEREYRFCFTALIDIPRDAEITVGWDLRSHPRLRECLESQYNSHKKTSEDEKQYIYESVETILAHFGDCACEERPDTCLMGHFDNRLAHLGSEAILQNAKSNKKRKSSKRSPPENLLDDHSRADSEHILHEDDADDNRSTSRSTRSKPSREQTPTSASIRDTAAKDPEISERDRKKLLQEEALFNKLEEKQQVSRKKKRHSGSNVNTPSAAISVGIDISRSVATTNGFDIQKQMGRRNSVNSTTNTPAPSTRNRLYHQTSYFNQGHTPSDTSPLPQSPHPPPNVLKDENSAVTQVFRPIYATIGSQTGITETPNEVTKPSVFGKSIMSLSHRLLGRSLSRLAETVLENKLEKETAGQEDLIRQSSEINVSTSHSVPPVVTPSPASMSPDARDDVEEVEMVDADQPIDDNVAGSAMEVSDPRLSSPLVTQQPLQSSHPPINPPAPPWQAPLASMQVPQPSRSNIRLANLHVDLPPPPLQSISSLDSISTATPGIPSGPGNQAYANASSAVANLMSAPSMTPMKKKMSLSDYTAKLKAKTPAFEKSQSMVELESSSPVTSRQQLPSDLVDTPEAIPDASSAILPSHDHLDPMQLDPR